jgi:DNA-binding transcriptional MocR family regulator
MQRIPSTKLSPFTLAGCFATRASRIETSEIRELLKLINREDIVSFAGGIPDPTLLPLDNVREANVAIFAEAATGCEALQYSTSEGHEPLRRWIADYMGRSGVPCAPRNILITSGSQQALDFLGKLFITPGDRILVTAPTYLGALQAFNAYEPRYGPLLPQNVGDAEDVQSERSIGPTKFGYVVSDFANPTGNTLDFVSRQRILASALAGDYLLIEDAAYSELRFEGTPIPSIMSMGVAAVGSIDEARTIYCGTFSKTVAPGLRVGWICAARTIIDKLVLIKQGSDVHTSTLNQMIVFHFVSRHFHNHMTTVRSVYARRQSLMQEYLAESMPACVNWTKPQGGMYVWIELPKELDAAKLLERSIQEEGVAFVPGQAFFAGDPRRSTLRLSYSLATEAQMRTGIRRLAAVINRSLPVAAL